MQVVMYYMNNFIYCLSRYGLLHTYLSQYNKLLGYVFHHYVSDVNIGDTCNNEILKMYCIMIHQQYHGILYPYTVAIKLHSCNNINFAA